MVQQPRRFLRLALMLLLAAGYGLWLSMTSSPTGSQLLDGTLGVALGLYICSHPAAAAIDLLYLDRLMLQRIGSEWTEIGWVALNAIVLLVGCLVTIAGAIQFVG